MKNRALGIKLDNELCKYFGNNIWDDLNNKVYNLSDRFSVKLDVGLWDELDAKLRNDLRDELILELDGELFTIIWSMLRSNDLENDLGHELGFVKYDIELYGK